MTKSIPLSGGKFAIVDDCDFEELSKYRWHLNSNGYARRSYREHGVNRKVYMHQQILNSVGKTVDHIDHDPLNNRRDNLRVCSDSQNQANERISKNNKSGYKGVYFRNDTQRWCSHLTINYRHITCGCFSTAEDAARAYDKVAHAHFGEFALLNFPLDRLLEIGLSGKL